MRTKDQQSIFAAFENSGHKLDDNLKWKIIEKIDSITTYKPKVGVFGKTGSGKSSLANALFGSDICPISDIAACTREPQEVLLSFEGENGLTLVDVPGVGESSDRDTEYGELYARLLPELDLVLWVLKADDRAFTTDIMFYENIVRPHQDMGKSFFFVLNQVDKIEPFREWDVHNHVPGPKQSENIGRKINVVTKYFSVANSKVIPVSANEKYNLVTLVDEIVFSLPPEKLATFAKNIDSTLISKQAFEHVKTASSNYILSGAGTGASIGAMVAGPIGAIIGGVIGGALGWISSKCYISTATMLSLGKADNCYELQMLRNFRDTWLVQQKGGKELIERYYATAPAIVDSIDRLPDAKDVYAEIWKNHLSEIVSDIKNLHYEYALGKYSLMVDELNNYHNSVKVGIQ